MIDDNYASRFTHHVSPTTLDFDRVLMLVLQCPMHTMPLNNNGAKQLPLSYPLPIARALQWAERACAGGDKGECHDAVMLLASAVTCYLGAVAVGQYSQALYTGQ